MDNHDIMKWRYNPNKRGCIFLQQGIYQLIPDFVICVTPHRESAEVWTFQENENKEVTHDDSDIKIEENPQNDNEDSARQLPCQGDTGGGHWMQGGKDGTQNVVIGVQLVASEMCGQRNPESLMHSINNEDDLDWIKSHAVDKCGIFRKIVPNSNFRANARLINAKNQSIHIHGSRKFQ